MSEERLRDQFEQAFGATPDIVVRSPGRVNLIGEHTDYSDGWTLPVALDLGTEIAAQRRDDRVLRIVAPRLDAVDEVSVEDLHPRHGPEWSRYVRGVVALLDETGRDIVGADILLDGNLPIGAGLSSSASVELGTMVAFAALADYTIDATAIARLGQRVENEIIGVQSGIMDQLAIALA
jgi:galactokinase